MNKQIYLKIFQFIPQNFHSFLSAKQNDLHFLPVPKNCAELYNCGQKTSGVYKINPDGNGLFSVYCDQATNGGGWTVIQKRLDGSTDFFRGWSEYKHGFGNLKREFWLGLDRIHRLTHQQRYKLRVDLEDWDRKTAYAVYGLFGVADEKNKYKLSLGSYAGE